MKRIIHLIIITFLIHSYHIAAVVIGSTTAVSLESSALFPSADIDNALLGFGWFTNGFTLEDSLTTCTFNGAFPVSGDVILNGGTLYLLKNLILRDVASLQSIGTVIGNKHCLDIAQSVAQLTSAGGVFEDVTLFCRADIDIVGTFTFRGNCEIRGLCNSALNCNASGALFVDSGSVLTLGDIALTGTAIACIDDTARLVLDDVTWIQPASMHFYIGSITFEDQVKFINAGTFYYESTQTSTILANSQLTIADSMSFSVGRDPVTWNEPLHFVDKTSLLHVDNAHLITRSPGAMLTNGTIILERGVTLDMVGTTSDKGLILGDGNPAHDVIVRLVPGCAVTHNSGCWTYNDGYPNGLQSASITSFLIRNTYSQIYVAQSLLVNNFTVQLLTSMVMPMQVAPGKTVLYARAGVVLPQIEFVMTAQQVNYYTYLLGGSCDFFVTKGTLPLYMQVYGPGNTLRGNGGVAGALIFLSSASTLRCGMNGFINNMIMLNGGTFTLDSDLTLQANASIVGPGIIDLQSNRMTLNLGNFNGNTPLYWKGTTGFIRMEGKVSLTNTWTISGKVVLDGANNHFSFETGGEIVIEKGSQLILKNIELHGVHGNNIRCLDENGGITFLNTEWFLDGDYSFTVGAMQFYRKNLISGDYNFAYDSPQTSTVRVDGKLYFTDDIHLIMGRSGTIEPFYFEDNTSTVGFDNSKLIVKPTGLSFTRGTFFGMRNIEVEILSTSTANGLIFGNGTVAGDMKLIMDPGCTAQFDTGHVTFNVTSGDGVKSKSKTAELRRGAASVFYLKQNLTLADITIDVNHFSSLIIDPGLMLSYNRGRIVLNVGVFDLTGIRYSNTTTLLAGNHNISLVNGTLPMATLVMGTGNTVDGVGNVSGPIILANSYAALTCGITGYLSSYILLNGGSLTLSNDLKLTNGVTFHGSGTIAVGPHNLEMGSVDTPWLGNINWNLNNSTISLYGNIDLRGAWQFSGEGEIKARGQTLSLKNGGSIVVAPGSRLTLRGLYIEGIAGTNVTCLGDDSVLILDDVSWEQYDSYFTFPKGAFIMRNSIALRGDGGIFAYESNQTSTIDSYTHVLFDTNITFSYDPSIASSSLLFLSDQTSIVQLHNATAYSSAVGLQLLNGRLTVEGITTMRSDVTQTVSDDGLITINDGGIMLGNGILDNDCACMIANGAQLYLAGGSLKYNNANPNAFKMQNDVSILEIGSGARFFMMQNFAINKGQVVFDDQAIFTALRGKILTGPTYAKGFLKRNTVNG